MQVQKTDLAPISIQFVKPNVFEVCAFRSIFTGVLKIGDRYMTLIDVIMSGKFTFKGI